MKTFTLSNGKTITRPRSYKIPITIVIVIFAYISIRMTGFNIKTLATRGYQFFVILRDMVPPNVGDYKNIINPLLDTIKMSLLGTLAGSIIAIPFAVVASSNIVHNKVVVFIVKFFMSLVRTLPTLVTALIATYIFGLGTMAGTIAIMLFSFAYVGKMLYEDIETTDLGAYEAMDALGCSKVRAFIGGVFPQIIPSYLSMCLYCFEGNVRYAAILGYVGAGGIGLILDEKIGWRQYDSVGMIIIMLLVTVFIIENLSHYLRMKLS